MTALAAPIWTGRTVQLMYTAYPAGRLFVMVSYTEPVPGEMIQTPGPSGPSGRSSGGLDELSQFAASSRSCALRAEQTPRCDYII